MGSGIRLEAPLRALCRGFSGIPKKAASFAGATYLATEHRFSGPWGLPGAARAALLHRRQVRLAGTVPGGLFACVSPECLSRMSSGCCAGTFRIVRRGRLACRTGNPVFSVRCFRHTGILLQIHKCFSAAYTRSAHRMARALPQGVLSAGRFLKCRALRGRSFCSARGAFIRHAPAGRCRCNHQINLR